MNTFSIDLDPTDQVPGPASQSLAQKQPPECSPWTSNNHMPAAFASHSQPPDINPSNREATGEPSTALQQSLPRCPRKRASEIFPCDFPDCGQVRSSSTTLKKHQQRVHEKRHGAIYDGTTLIARRHPKSNPLTTLTGYAMHCFGCDQTFVDNDAYQAHVPCAKGPAHMNGHAGSDIPTKPAKPRRKSNVQQASNVQQNSARPRSDGHTHRCPYCGFPLWSNEALLLHASCCAEAGTSAWHGTHQGVPHLIPERNMQSVHAQSHFTSHPTTPIPYINSQHNGRQTIYPPSQLAQAWTVSEQHNYNGQSTMQQSFLDVELPAPPSAEVQRLLINIAITVPRARPIPPEEWEVLFGVENLRPKKKAHGVSQNKHSMQNKAHKRLAKPQLRTSSGLRLQDVTDPASERFIEDDFV